MNKLLLAACLAALSSSSAFAAFVPCTPQGSNQIVGFGLPTSAQFLCAPNATANNMAGDGITVHGVSLRVTVDIQSFGVPGQTQSVLAMVTNSAGFNNPGPVACSGVMTPAGTLTGTATALAITAIPCVDVVNSFFVNVTGMPNGGNALPTNAVALVEYDTIICEAPEPGSLALLGSALAAMVAGTRRRRRAAARQAQRTGKTSVC